jgi:tetratricopeptide (TPR) repeat protein
MNSFIKIFNSAVFISIFITTPLFADENKAEPTYEDKESERIHFEAAKKLYKNDKYSEALELFMKAYARYPKPEILYNIGKCYDKLGDYKNAIKFYEQYILLNPKAEDKAEVEELIKNLKEAIQGPDKRSEEGQKQRGLNTDKIIGYSLLAGGALFVALGPVFYLKSDSIYNDVKDNNYDEKTKQAKIDDIHLYDNLSLASYITGGILIGSSVYFLYKGYYKNKSAMILPTKDGICITFSGDF